MILLTMYIISSSSRSTAESDVEGMANVFNEIIQEMSPEMQDHWNNHLHFCPVRVPELAIGWLMLLR